MNRHLMPTNTAELNWPSIIQTFIMTVLLGYFDESVYFTRVYE